MQFVCAVCVSACRRSFLTIALIYILYAQTSNTRALDAFAEFRRRRLYTSYGSVIVFLVLFFVFELNAHYSA